MEAPLPHDSRHSEADARFSHELSLVGGAVRLVAGGGAPRVTVIGLRGGALLVTLALAMGAAAGVLVRARWWPTGEAVDIVVEPHG
jgi:hypothetical protein